MKKMMLDLLERGKHFSRVLESFFLVAGKNISVSPHSVTCLSTDS